jgi:hypothetical protein
MPSGIKENHIPQIMSGISKESISTLIFMIPSSYNLFLPPVSS